MVKRGEVRWYEHPRSGRRPLLILTRDEAIAVLHQVLAVPATRTVREIPILDRADGMPLTCCLTLDNLTVIRPSLCLERITAVRRTHARGVRGARARHRLRALVHAA
jgi:mRNA interferase MazF